MYVDGVPEHKVSTQTISDVSFMCLKYSVSTNTVLSTHH